MSPMIKTGARVVIPKEELPPVVVPKTNTAIVPDPYDSPSYKGLGEYLDGIKSSLEVFDELEQGTDEWLAARCGIVTASVVHLLVTSKTLAVADNLTSQDLVRTLVAERLTGHVEPIFPNRDMERGTLDEPYARDVYSEHYAPATEIGFMVRTFNGFKIGYSPDGLVGDDGLIEIKSRKQKIQLKTFILDQVPAENMAQIQTGLLVSGRKWLDYVSYCGGMPLYVKRVYPDPAWQTAIKEAARTFETRAEQIISDYLTAIEGKPATERIDHYQDLEITF